jgi:hypothetical protein
MERLRINTHDYKYHKKWCYLWEGIYLSSELIQQLLEANPHIEYLNILYMPPNEEIKNRYTYRWFTEFGEENFHKNKHKIDEYLNNVFSIREYLLNKMKNSKITSYVIEDTSLEDQLRSFYKILYNRLSEIGKNSYTEWKDKMLKDPKTIIEFNKFISND